MQPTEEPSTVPVAHMFTLYRTGPVADRTSGYRSEEQLWARGHRVFQSLEPGGREVIVLDPQYGSAAALYRVDIRVEESAEPGWLQARIQLQVNNQSFMGWNTLPISWYIGHPTDWPSGLARFPEVCGETEPWQAYPAPEQPRMVWTVAAQRLQ